MHILIITTYFEPDSGAAAVRLSRLAHILQARGHQITVLTTMPHYPQGQIREGYRGKWSIVEERDGIRIVRAWLWATPSSKISRRLISQNTFMWSAALRGLGLRRPDVVLIEAQPVFTSLAGVFLSVIKRVPYVLNVSDLWPDHLLSVGALKESHPVYRIARRLVDATYRRAAGIIAMSPAWASAIERYIGSGDKISVVYNGVDLTCFRPNLDTTDFKAKHGLEGPKIVSFIGTFATQYDFETMFAAVKQFSERADVTFVCIGGGTQGEKVKSLLSNLSNVTWIDWVDHYEIPLAWAASDVTFWAMRDHPLYKGTIPAKLYEAIASGIPVVAAMEGEGAAMIQRSGVGITVNCGDVGGLSDAIGRLLENSEQRIQFSHAARAYAEANFDPEKVATAYEQILISVYQARMQRS